MRSMHDHVRRPRTTCRAPSPQPQLGKLEVRTKLLDECGQGQFAAMAADVAERVDVVVAVVDVGERADAGHGRPMFW